MYGQDLQRKFQQVYLFSLDSQICCPCNKKDCNNNAAVQIS